ncbi:unnamed protein product [Bemisia tabaci]|uniref:Potassium channel domain-containing protein n=1 Tax=Bemisia tabaci TaxID=7038 RepID=A0A9P0A720_BEMTA|nr:PREDICTED: TWiK family of potassium channels protein 7 isoform X1 [Bemisia tabaci]CAH0387891.1 unnamed protein product [Bemisia tabaci]
MEPVRYYGPRYGRRQKSWSEKCEDYLRQFVAFLFSNIGIICLVVGYTIGGAVMFQYIEGPLYSSRVQNIVEFRNRTADVLWELTCCSVNVFSEQEWRERVNASLMAYQRKIIEEVQKFGYEGEDFHSNRWSFAGAFLYSLTVITTIGYGNNVPRTVWGKLVTILYAIGGVPLFLLYLSNIGDLLATSFKWIYAKCCLCRGCPYKKRASRMARRHNSRGSGHWQDEIGETTEGEDSDDEDSISFNGDPQTVTVPVFLCLIIMVGYVVGGATLFSKWEDWDLLDGSYFCFISLSTIGFGDIVPGDKITGGGTSGDGSGGGGGGGPEAMIELSFIFCSLYLMLGMALIAMCFNLMQEEVVHKIRTSIQVLKRITHCSR